MMEALDAFWHLLNFIGPAAGIGLLSSALGKGIWRRELRGVAWLSLSAWATSAATAAALAGLWLVGRDGRMATYLGMVAAAAIALWWRGFVRRH